MDPFSERLIARSPGPLRRPVEVLVGTAEASMRDRIPGLAAEIAFWVLLSLPALLLATIAAAGVIGDTFAGGDWQDQLVNRTVEVARVALTEGTIDSVVRPILEELLVPGGIGLVSVSFAAAVWTASRAVKVVLTTLAIVTDREDARLGWQDRIIGFVVTLGALVVGIVLLPLLLAGPNLGEQIDEWARSDLRLFADLWRQLYWPAVVLGATPAIALLYHLGVPGRTRWRHEVPGAVLATAVWLAGSGGLRLYGTWILDGDSVYGPLAGPIVFLLWLWLTGFAVLLGAEFNAALRRTARGS